MAFVGLFAAATFGACSKDEDNDSTLGTSTVSSGKTDIKVENGADYNSQIDSVKLILYASNTYNVFTSAYAEGGFALDLPASVDDKYLSNELVLLSLLGDIKVSNLDVRVKTEMTLAAYKRTEVAGYSIPVGEFYHGTADETHRGYLYYVDGDVTITGTYSQENKENGRIEKNVYEINAKKGWNIMYEEDQTSETMKLEIYTTKAPADAKWYFHKYKNN
jgi:hypothetical protein